MIGVAFLAACGNITEASLPASLKAGNDAKGGADLAKTNKSSREVLNSKPIPVINIPVSNSIPANVTTAVATNMLAETLANFKQGKKVSQSEWNQSGNLLEFLSQQGDKNVLPLLQEIFGAADAGCLFDVISAYIQIAGLDALDFVKKIRDGDDPRYDKDGNRRITYILFARQIAQKHEQQQPVDGEKMADILDFALDLMLTTKDMDLVWRYDQALCKAFPRYETSVQREQVAVRVITRNPPFELRGSPFSFGSIESQFREVRQEIEKIPEPQRKDFCSKDELLDPNRKK
jgi:CheY-like chemotaxis protein